MKLFPWRTSAKRARPQSEQSTASVDVTPLERLRGVTPGPTVYPVDRPLDPDLTGCDVAHVRAHLPNATTPASSLTAARHAKVLDEQRAFLADTSHTVAPPDRQALIESLGFAADVLRDRVVIA